MGLAKIGRDSLGSFSNHFQATNYGVLRFKIIKESFNIQVGNKGLSELDFSNDIR